MIPRRKYSGLKPDAEAADSWILRVKRVVGERSVLIEGDLTRIAGRYRSENAGTSSEKTCEKHVHRKPKVS